MRRANDRPIHSSLSSDPDMIQLLEEFVAHLGTRVDALRRALAEDNLDQMIRLAHQLRGASGGYGFDVIGEAAAALEDSLKTADRASDVEPELNELLHLCQRATAAPASC